VAGVLRGKELLAREAVLVSMRSRLATLQGLKNRHLAPLAEVLDKPGGGLTFFVFKSSSKLLGRTGYQKRVPADVARRWMRDILQGLLYLHSEGVEHGMLALETCVLDDAGKVQLLLYGLPHQLRECEDSSFAACAHDLYRAPEIQSRLAGSDLPVGVADMFALGVVAYQLSYGVLPFAARKVDRTKSAAAVAAMVREQPLPPRSGFNIDPALEDLLAALLCKDPLQRPTLAHVAAHPWITRDDDWPLELGDLEGGWIPRWAISQTWAHSEALRALDFLPQERPAAPGPTPPGMMAGGHLASKAALMRFVRLPLPTALQGNLHNVASLPPLASLPSSYAEVLKLCEEWRGPTSRCQWLLPRRVLQGWYPDSAQVAVLLESGCTMFVQLGGAQEADQLGLEPYTRAAQSHFTHWFKRVGSHGLDKRTREVLASRGYTPGFRIFDFPSAKKEGKAEPAALDTITVGIVEQLVPMIHAGECLYIHDVRGCGRSGVVCATLLAELYGIGSFEAIHRINLGHLVRSGTLALEAMRWAERVVALSALQIEQVHRCIVRMVPSLECEANLRVNSDQIDSSAQRFG